MIVVQAKLLDAVAKWAYQHDDRPHLNLVRFGDGEMIACDGHRLVRVPLEIPVGTRFGLRPRDIAAVAAAQREIPRDGGDLGAPRGGEEGSLKVFTNGVDTYVAPNIESLPALFHAQNGFTMEDEGESLDEWREVPGDKPITICNIHDRGADDKETHTAAEWSNLQEPGLLCSTEW